jgi:uncharacterized protein (UPF0305 family)
MNNLIELFNEISIGDDDVKMIHKTIKKENYVDKEINMLIDGIKMISIDNKTKKRHVEIEKEYIKTILRLIKDCREKKSIQEINTFMPGWIDSH